MLPEHDRQNKGTAYPNLATCTRLRGAWPDFKFSFYSRRSCYPLWLKDHVSKIKHLTLIVFSLP